MTLAQTVGFQLALLKSLLASGFSPLHRGLWDTRDTWEQSASAGLIVFD